MSSRWWEQSAGVCSGRSYLSLEAGRQGGSGAVSWQLCYGGRYLLLPSLATAGQDLTLNPLASALARPWQRPLAHDLTCHAGPPATPGCSVRLPLERRTRLMPIAWGPLPNIAQYRAQLQVGGCCSIHCSGRVLPGWKPALSVWLGCFGNVSVSRLYSYPLGSLCF